MAFELWRDGTGQVHEVMVDDAHDMKAVGDDPGVGEEAADDVTVGTGEVDTDHLHFVTAAQGKQVGAQLRDASPRSDVENAVVAQIAKRGAEALLFVQGVFVDTEIAGALQGESFIGLAACELGVDTAHRGGTQPLVAGDGAGADAVMVVFENLLPEGFGAVPALGDTGQPRKEAAQATGALEPSGVDVQDTRASERLQMPGLAQVTSLAADTGAEAVGTVCGFKGRL